MLSSHHSYRYISVLASAVVEQPSCELVVVVQPSPVLVLNFKELVVHVHDQFKIFEFDILD